MRAASLLAEAAWTCLVACLLTASPLSAEEPPSELWRWLEPQHWQRDVPGPVVELGAPGEFDDQHLFAPAVAREDGRFWLWYSGSRGSPGNRVFRLGLATSADGRAFAKHAQNPLLEFADGERSVLTPAILRQADGGALREGGRWRLYFSAARLGRGGLHTLHQSWSNDGVHWAPPSPALLDHAYCPTVLKTARGYEMWYSDVSRRPWVIRHAQSADGERWTVTPRPVLQLSQAWEGEVLVYPTVLVVEGVYLMWYGSYDRAIRRETTAIGFAASTDGLVWHKSTANPVFRPDPQRPWESNYVGSGSVLRLPDGSFRYWYASRKAPPFRNLYFALNTARWSGPPSLPSAAEAATAERAAALLRLPPQSGDQGWLMPTSRPASPAAAARSVEALEVVDEQNLIARVWYLDGDAAPSPAAEATFVDLWIQGLDTRGMTSGSPAAIHGAVRVIGNKLIDTTCGKRSLPLLEIVRSGEKPAAP